MTDDSEPIPVNEPWEGYSDSIPEDGPAWNRSPGKSAADVNLDAAPFGFKVTGDAAWDTDSDDYAMFTAEGNVAVAAIVKTARLKCRSEDEATVLAWIQAEKERIAADTAERPYKRGGVVTGMSEVRDTMVRETVAYALDEAWLQAYGHRFS